MATLNQYVPIGLAAPVAEIEEFRRQFPHIYEALNTGLATQLNQLNIRVGGSGSGGSTVNLDELTSFGSFNTFHEPAPNFFNYQTFFQLPEAGDVAGVKSTNNSTTTPLSGGASFNASATGEQNDYNYVFVSLKTDVAGTLYIEFSNDAGSPTNWDSSSTYSVAAGTHEFQPIFKGPRHCRVRYVNGSSAQSYLRLATYYVDTIGFVASPLNAAVGLDAPASNVRQNLAWLDIARGLRTGIISVKKFGRNKAVGTSYVPIAQGGVYQTPQFSSATTLRIKSGGNANDTAAGSGARAITLIGLDENGLEVSETVATAGASASSATTTTFTRLYRAYVSSSGTYATPSAGSHSGDIVIENGSGGTTWATIDSTNFPKSQTEIGAYSVPDGYTAYVRLREVTIDTGKTCDLAFFWRAGADESAAPYSAMRTQSVVKGIAGGSIMNFANTEVPFGPYTGPCDIGFMGKVSAGTAEISVEFEIILVAE